MDEGNVLVKRLKEAIKLEAERPELRHPEQYPHQMLSRLSAPWRSFVCPLAMTGTLSLRYSRTNGFRCVFSYFGPKRLQTRSVCLDRSQ